MKINLAHIRQKTTSGAWIDFAVFDAKSTSNINSYNDILLADLTRKARSYGLKIDISSLAYKKGSKMVFHGDKNVVDFLSTSGLPRWTHKIDV